MRKIIIEHRLQILLLISLTLFVWHKITYQVPLGEGYYYFDRTQDFISATGALADLNQTDVFAKIIFDLLPPIFGDNLTLYMVFQLAIMALIHILFYICIYRLTNNKFISLFASIFFAGSYIGQFEMLGTANYQRFLQRLPNHIFLFISLMFLNDYLVNKKILKLFLSYLFFAVAVLLAHFSTFFLGFIVLYILVYYFIFRRKFLHIGIFVSAIFVFINYYLISHDHLTPSADVLAFIRTKPDLAEKILLQFSSLVIPPFVIEQLAAVAQPFNKALIIITIPIIVTFMLFIPIIYKKNKQLFLVYFSSLLYIPVSLFLNLYLGKVDPVFNISGYNYYFLPKYYLGVLPVMTEIKGDRYYLVPTFFVAIVIGVLFYTLLSYKRKLLIFSSAVFLTLYLIYNSTLIWNAFDSLQPLSNDMRAYIYYISSYKYLFKPNSIVVVPEYFMWPSSYIRTFYGHQDMRFVPLKKGFDKEFDSDAIDQVLVVDYDYRNKHFINKSDEFKKNKAIQSINF